MYSFWCYYTWKFLHNFVAFGIFFLSINSYWSIYKDFFYMEAQKTLECQIVCRMSNAGVISTRFQITLQSNDKKKTGIE